MKTNRHKSTLLRVHPWQDMSFTLPVTNLTGAEPRRPRTMKTSLALLGLVSTASLVVAAPPTPSSPPPPPPPPVFVATTAPGANVVYVYEQKPITSLPQLVPPAQAQQIIDKFKAGYAKLGSPRILIYVNRDLVDEKSGLKLAGRTERTVHSRSSLNSTIQPAGNANAGSVTVNAGGNVSVKGGPTLSGPGQVAGSSERVVNNNTYRDTAAPLPALADKQTVRDVERLFGRPLRLGGATLADQRVATQLIADKPLDAFISRTEGEAARKDREALAKIADVVVEVLISSRPIVVQEVSGDKTYTVPDIQVTAIRLNDARIIGQASASDILGKDRYAGRIVTNFDVREITEATALALMEDMMVGMK